MKSKVAIVLIALASNLAVSATSITVYGYGADRESAKKDAFKTAIETKCGVEVLSDREHFNNRTTLNKVTTYSSCRVENYKILEESPGKLKIQVELQRNNIAHRLQTNNDNRSVVDSAQLTAQLSTYKEEKIAGDRLIDDVFRDYPSKAYNIKSKPYLTTDTYRDAYIVVPFEVRWNYNFLKSLDDTFALMRTKDGPGLITVTSKDPKALLLGNTSVFYMDDLYRLDYIKSKFNYENQWRLNVRARDTTGKVVVNICYSPDYRAGAIFFSTGSNNRLAVFGSDVYTDTLRIKLKVPADIVYDIYTDIVPANSCK